MGDLQNAINEFEPIKSAKDPFGARPTWPCWSSGATPPIARACGGQPTEEDQTAALAASL